MISHKYLLLLHLILGIFSVKLEQVSQIYFASIIEFGRINIDWVSFKFATFRR